MQSERINSLLIIQAMFKQDDQWDQWVSSDLFEKKCYDCVYLPLCMGGCRKTRLKQKGTGSFCSLVPTNTSYILKQIALGQFKDMTKI